nr:unnamed protein product [Callosobruchus analis]CAI5855237.1 unnamed protein product [Callosobruchus analis]
MSVFQSLPNVEMNI